MLQNGGSVFSEVSLAIFTDPYYLECLYLSQMQKTQLSLLQMGQKTTLTLTNLSEQHTTSEVVFYSRSCVYGCAGN